MPPHDSDDLREMGIHKVGIRAHILKAIAAATLKGADLGGRRHAQEPHSGGEEGDVAQEREDEEVLEHARAATASGGKKAAVRQTNIGWTQNLLRSFVVPAAEARAVRDEADPNMDALDAMVTAAKAGGYNKTPSAAWRTPTLRQNSTQSTSALATAPGASGGEAEQQQALLEEAQNSTAAGGEGGEGWTEVRMEGWMFKRSGGYLFRRWRRRWFTLELGGSEGPRLVRRLLANLNISMQMET